MKSNRDMEWINFPTLYLTRLLLFSATSSLLLFKLCCLVWGSSIIRSWWGDLIRVYKLTSDESGRVFVSKESNEGTSTSVAFLKVRLYSECENIVEKYHNEPHNQPFGAYDVIWFLSSEGNTAILFPRLSNVWELLWMADWMCQGVFGSLSVAEAAPKAHSLPGAFD